MTNETNNGQVSETSHVAERQSVGRSTSDGSRYRGEADAGGDQQSAESSKTGVLDFVPAWVVTLGAGSLFTSALLTGGASVFFAYSASQGHWYGYSPHQIVMGAVLHSFSAVFQLSGVYLARKRMRWLWVMLASAAAVLSFVSLPFALVAFACLGLGKRHFASYTPVERLRGAIDP